MGPSISFRRIEAAQKKDQRRPDSVTAKELRWSGRRRCENVRGNMSRETKLVDDVHVGSDPEARKERVLHKEAVGRRDRDSFLMGGRRDSAGKRK